jgi:hypothetical protein
MAPGQYVVTAEVMGKMTVMDQSVSWGATKTRSAMLTVEAPKPKPDTHREGESPSSGHDDSCKS